MLDKLLKSFLLMGTLLYAAPVWAQKRAFYTLIPVDHPRLVAGEGVVAGYELPCGSELIGLVLRQPAFEELMVGILVRQRAEVCVGMGQRATLRLPYFQPSHVKTVRSFDPLEYQNKPRVITAEAMHLVQEQSGQSLDLSFASQCGRPAGILVAPQGENLGIGFVELDAGKQKDCRPEMYLTGLVGLRDLDSARLRPFQTDATALDEAYYLRLARIRPDSVKRQDGKLSLRYARRCNEAPVGLVSDYDAETGDTTVGMLVARYLNQPCADDKVRYFWTSYETAFVPPAPLDAIKLQAPTRNMWDLTLRRPNHVRLRYEKSGAELAMAYYGGCEQELGAVLVDEDNAMVAGVLTRATDAPCKSKLKEVSLTQRFATHSPVTTAALPLSLKGGETH